MSVCEWHEMVWLWKSADDANVQEIAVEKWNVGACVCVCKTRMDARECLSKWEIVHEGDWRWIRAKWMCFMWKCMEILADLFDRVFLCEYPKGDSLYPLSLRLCLANLFNSILSSGRPLEQWLHSEIILTYSQTRTFLFYFIFYFRRIGSIYHTDTN